MKYLNRETVIRSFSEKEMLLSTLQMSYCPKPESHIRDKFKVVSD